MSGDTGVRRLLPQNSQMQSFSFMPNNFVPRENQKNYVFVDEHNRHKRLKVMRACEGCRRRKIKCDAATTNTWPCSACIRLKLHCVPPTVNYDNGQGFEPERAGYESGSGDDEYHNQLPLQQHLAGPPKATQQIYQQQVPYNDSVNAYHSLPYAQHPQSHAAMQSPMQFSDMQGSAGVVDSHYPPIQTVFPVPPAQQQPQVESPEYHQDRYGQQELADLLGGLKVDADGSAPYLRSKKKNPQLEEPAFEDFDDYKHVLPPITSGPDLKIRIPPELMPDEETAMQYFDVYFSDVHPYVPVLNKSLFYRQWHNNRESISPLILEAVFAIGGRLTDEPSQGQQWLALAGKHADSFMDVPRLSTLQGMLILLKARESMPKRGYYYRSWMSVVQCVAMAKDLGLDEHYEEHKAGKSCGSEPTDCAIKSRIWQTIFVCEVMIGSPQGRTFSTSIDSLEFNVPRSILGEESEYTVTRNFTYFARVVRNVRVMCDVLARIKEKKDWGIDPELVQLNPTVMAWINDIPSDLQITFPTDESPPWLPSHFVGNLHSYYHLSIIMLHRPQLSFMDPSGPDGQWKQHMMICYASAKILCRLQEAILQCFGLVGLLSTQRGINFTIYCILTCTVLHLVAITSPDPDLNSDARGYFTRHMRILEKCTSSWPMPDMQQQIDALREAFSADTRKPFVLKPSFPYGSPGSTVNSSPPRVGQYHQSPQLLRQSPIDQSLDQHHSQQQHPVSYTTHPITPPISASSVDTKGDSPAVQSLVMMATGQRVPQQQQTVSSSVPIADTSSMNWNPSRIFDQWNTTFGTPSTQTSSAPVPAPLKVPISGPQELLNLPELQSSMSLPLPPSSQSMTLQQYSGAPMPTFVSPSMWQESVASVYEIGLKRQWDYDSNGMGNQVQKRAR